MPPPKITDDMLERDCIISFNGITIDTNSRTITNGNNTFSIGSKPVQWEIFKKLLVKNNLFVKESRKKTADRLFDSLKIFEICENSGDCRYKLKIPDDATITYPGSDKEKTEQVADTSPVVTADSAPKESPTVEFSDPDEEWRRRFYNGIYNVYYIDRYTGNISTGKIILDMENYVVKLMTGTPDDITDEKVRECFDNPDILTSSAENQALYVRSRLFHGKLLNGVHDYSVLLEQNNTKKKKYVMFKRIEPNNASSLTSLLCPVITSSHNINYTASFSFIIITSLKLDLTDKDLREILMKYLLPENHDLNNLLGKCDYLYADLIKYNSKLTQKGDKI